MPGSLSDKRDFIDTLFDDLEDRCAYLKNLFAGGHQDEALILCCAYLDGLANNLYYKSDRSAANFVRLLRERGGEPDLQLISPLALVRWMKDEGPAKAGPIADKISRCLKADIRRLDDEKSLLAKLKPALHAAELDRVKREIWRGSVAFIAYRRLRVPFIHRLRGPGGVVVGSTSGIPGSELMVDFNTLYRALSRIVKDLHTLSRKSVRWFGHDFRR